MQQGSCVNQRYQGVRLSADTQVENVGLNILYRVAHAHTCPSTIQSFDNYVIIECIYVWRLAK